MDSLLTNKYEIIQKLKIDTENDVIGMEDINLLLKYFLSIEDQEKFNSEAANCLIILLCVSGQYGEANLRRSIYKTRRLYLSNEEFSQIFSIAKRLVKEPFIDVYGHIQFFFKSPSSDVQVIAAAFINIYEKQQIEFLSKFYSKLKLSTLTKLLGKLIFINYIGSRYNENTTNSLCLKYGWIFQDNYFITKKVDYEMLMSSKNDLSFINTMTVSLENLAKSNASIRSNEA